MRLSVERAAAALCGGLVVAVPTETFYGLAARLDDAAVESVFRLKGRRPTLPSPVLVPSATAVESLLVAPPHPRVRALMARFWPGALTLVLPGAREGLPAGLVGEDGAVGVRQDGHPALAAVLSLTSFCVTGTSANLTGTPPVRRGEDVDAVFDGLAGYAGHVGGGPTAGAAPSTVVRAADDLELLRAGGLPFSDVRALWEAWSGRDDV